MHLLICMTLQMFKKNRCTQTDTETFVATWKVLSSCFEKVSQHQTYCAQQTQFFCLFQTQCPQCRLCYLSYGYQGRHSAQGLDSYGFPKWKDRPRQDYSSALPQWLFQWLDTYTVFGGGGGTWGCISTVSTFFLDNASTKAQVQRSVCFLDLSNLAESNETYFT